MRDCEQLVQLVLGAIRLYIHSDPDLLIARRHAGIEREQTLQIDRAFEHRRDRTNVDSTSRRVQDGRRRDATRERVQQELDRVRTLVVAEQHGRLAVRELERAGARVILLPRAEEIPNRRAVLAAPDPSVARPELEVRERRLIAQQLHRLRHLLEVEAVANRQSGHGCTPVAWLKVFSEGVGLTRSVAARPLCYKIRSCHDRGIRAIESRGWRSKRKTQSRY